MTVHLSRQNLEDIEWQDSAAHHLFHLCLEGFCDDILHWIRVEGRGLDLGSMVNWTHPNMDMKTPLLAACLNCQSSTAAILIKEGADTQQPDQTGLTALMAAYRFPNNRGLLDDLLEQSSDINAAPSPVGNSALMLMAGTGAVEHTRALLRRPGIHVNQRNQRQAGQTALLWAAATGQVETTRLLLQHPGVDINQADLHGFTALMAAAFNGQHLVAAELLRHPETDPEAQSLTGYTARMLAVLCGHWAVVSLLGHPRGQTEATPPTSSDMASTEKYFIVAETL